MSLLNTSWKYINEGNAHIVIQILKTNYAVRLIKEDSIKVEQITARNSVKFVNLVMAPLLNNDSCDIEEILELSPQELNELSRDLTKFRPKNRVSKSVLCSFAIKAPNLTMLSLECETNYCLEIKPKEGFMSENLKKHKKCYYCLKQFMKLHKKQITQISNYCPLDFFSGDRIRMKQALLHLIDNPQNNFKLFKNGTIVYGEKLPKKNCNEFLEELTVFEKSIDMFLDFIVDILLSNNNQYTHVLEGSREIHNTVKREFCDENNDLEKKSFLYNILYLQKLSKLLDIDAIDVKSLMDNNYEYVCSIIEQVESLNLNLLFENDRQLFFKAINTTHLALISAVVKDCSIMIRFSPEFVHGVPYIQIGENKVSFKISVTDLEPKSMKTLIKRKDTETKLLEIYEKHVETKYI